MNKVSYGGHTYEQQGLDFQDLLTFGSIVTPRIAGLLASATAMASENTIVNGEVLSFYKTIERIFSPDEWKTIMNLFIENPRNMLIIDGQSKNTDEIDEHFRGDLLRMMTVATRLAAANMGESKAFMSSLTESWQGIANSLSALIKEKTEALGTAISKLPKKQ